MSDRLHRSINPPAAQPPTPAPPGSQTLQVPELVQHIEMLRVVLDALPEGLEVADRTGRILFVNDAFGRITGIPVHQRAGCNILELIPDGELAQVLRTGRPVVGRRSRSRESGFEVVASAVPLLVDRELLGGVLVIQDISDVLRLSRDLHERIEQVESLSQQLGNLTRAKYTFADLAGSSPAMQAALHLGRQAAAQQSTVLLTGESGTGKELFAHAIHNASSRRGGPFVKINCAAVPEHLLESEFFGYEKGAFTGAAARKSGLFEVANGGTLFLDEVGDMPLALQSKLLRVLQEGDFYRLGGTAPVRVDVRIIAATNVPLDDMVAQKRFRRDLYYRLNVIHIAIPSLRERLTDLPQLVDAVLQRLNRRLGRQVATATPLALEWLADYPWPGNIRELENVLERSLLSLSAQATRLDVDALPALRPSRGPAPMGEGICTLREMEARLIARAMDEFGYSGPGKRRAAVALGISLATLYAKLKQYGLKPPPRSHPPLP